MKHSLKFMFLFMMILVFSAVILSAATLRITDPSDTSSTAMTVDNGVAFDLEVWITGNSASINAAGVFIDYTNSILTLNSVTLDDAIFSDTLQLDASGVQFDYNVMTGGANTSEGDIKLATLNFTPTGTGVVNFDFYIASDTTNRQSAVINAGTFADVLASSPSLALTVQAAGPDTSANLLANWSFEDWDGELTGSEADSWIRLNPTASNHVRQTTDQVRTGSKAVDMRSLGTSSYSRGMESAKFSGVIAENNYEFGVWTYKLGAGSICDSYIVDYQIEWFDVGEGSLGTETFEYDIASQDEWLEIKSSQVTAPVNAVSAVFKFGAKRVGGAANTGDIVYFDDAFVFEIDEDIPDAPEEAIIAITDPTDGDTSAVVDILVSGTTLNSATGDTVEFYKGGVLQTTVYLDADSGSFSDTITLSAETNVIAVKLIYNNGDSEAWDTITVQGEFTPTYGLRDDAGANLPTITYWYTDAPGDSTVKGADFDGTNLGQIDALYLKGATIKSWKNDGDGGNVTGALFSYKVWKSGDGEPGAYDTQSVEWTSDDGSGNQTWADGDGFASFSEVAVHELATSEGTWNVKILFSITGTGIPGITEDGPWTLTFDSGAVVPSDTWQVAGTVAPIARTAGNRAGVYVGFYEVGNTTAIDSTTTDAQGDFVLEVPKNQEGYVRAGGLFHLYENFATFTATEDTGLGTLNLNRAGDADNSNMINIFDASRVKAQDADIGGDANWTTNLGYVRTNFGEVGEDYKE